MKDLIKFIAEKLVDYPEQVSVKEIQGPNTTVIELRVVKQDMGKIIGKRGRNAAAMRTILRASTAKSQKHITLVLLEQVVIKPSQKSPDVWKNNISDQDIEDPLIASRFKEKAYGY